MFIAFQSNAYQRSGYQINGGVKSDVRPAGGKSNAASYHLSRHEYEVKEFNRLQTERLEAQKALEAKELEIADLEKKRAKLLANQQMQSQLLLLFMEAKRLEDERLRLEELVARFMRDEEECYILLMCLPFIV